jgi:hypothetical protein
MSAGELESGNAGEPAKLIRQRYREASDVIKKGKMCSLFINDLDAGAGRMGDATQYTVNNQVRRRRPRLLICCWSAAGLLLVCCWSAAGLPALLPCVLPGGDGDEGGPAVGKNAGCWPGQIWPQLACAWAASSAGSSPHPPAPRPSFPTTLPLQMVNATLMNIADNPTNVQLPGEPAGLAL